MLKRGTLGLLLSAIALTGGVLLFENRSGSRPTQPDGTIADEAASEQIFPFEEEDVEQFSLTRTDLEAIPDTEAEGAEQEETNTAAEEDATAEETTDEEPSTEGTTAEETEDTAEENEIADEIEFVKNEDGTWQMTTPEEAIAEGGAIAFLLNQLTSPIARPVSTPAASDTSSEGEENETTDSIDLEEFGLAEPIATVLLTANGQDYRLDVGGPDFSGDRRYVRAIALSSAGDQADVTSLYVVSGNILNAVNRPTADWIAITDEVSADEAPESEESTDEAPAEEVDTNEAADDIAPAADENSATEDSATETPAVE